MISLFKEVENLITKKYEWLDYYIDIDICGTTTYQVWISKKNEGNKSFYIGTNQCYYKSYDEFLSFVKASIIEMIEECEEDIKIYELGCQVI